MDAERAHNFAITALRLGLVSDQGVPTDRRLETSCWGIEFPNPVGLAAGFDKNCVAVGPLFKLGFGFVETGTVTPRPQLGNDRPRLFRLAEDNGIINRLGFNNVGHDEFDQYLKASRELNRGQIIGVNLGKNKNTVSDTSDYELGLSRFWESASYIVINVSSPNTPNLRDIQNLERLRLLLDVVNKVRNDQKTLTPVLLKVSPDLAENDLADIAQECSRQSVDGIIATNTTVSRPESLKSPRKSETGGLSGQPVFTKSNEVIKILFNATDGNIPIIGVGGIHSGDQALEKIRAGASLVQIYSGMIFEGPGLVREILETIVHYLDAHGVNNVGELIGIDA